MQKRTKKISVIAITVAIVAAGGGAFAYWTLQGSGTGSASTGSVQGEISANQTSVISDLRPGGSAQTLSGDFDNTGDTPIYVSTVTVSIASVVPLEGETCDATDYTLSAAEMTVNAEVPVGAGVGDWTGATLAFNNKAGVNQDGCQGATVNLSYAIA